MKTKHSILRRFSAMLLLLALFAGFSFTAYAGKGVGNTEPEVLHTDSPLYGKKALFCGDSICAASGADYSNMTRWGWAGRIARDYGMVYANRGVDGASISNVRGTNTIIAQLEAEANQGDTYDFVILEGGGNDGWDMAEIGTISDSTELNSFDESTFAGGLENLFCYAKTYFPNATIGYIMTFQIPVAFGNLNNMTGYYKVAEEICDKWDIPYLDLHSDKEFNELMNIEQGETTVDKIHPNGKGYDLIYPRVAEFMEYMVSPSAPVAVWIVSAAGIVVAAAVVIVAIVITKRKKKNA